MSRDTRWAARYQFLEECWRGQDRILLDAGLEAALIGGGLDGSSVAHDPVAQLLDLLLPSRPADGQAWFVLGQGRRAAALSRGRPETRFVSVSDAISVASEESWRFATIDLGGFIRDAGAGAGLSDRVDPEVLALVEALGERVAGSGPSRLVALSLPVAALGPAGDDDAADEAIEQFAALVDELLPGARLFGVAWPTMAGIYGLGGDDESSPRAEAADPLDAYDAELDAAEADWVDDETLVYQPSEDDLPIDYDSTRADPMPRFRTLLAVAGPALVVDALGEGVTLLELPSSEEVAPRGADRPRAVAGEIGGDDGRVGAGREILELRSQLHDARHQAQVLSVERQRLLEELDETRESYEELRAQVEDGGVASASTEGGGRRGERLDLALAQRQQLRWELDRARERIAGLEGRPVDELEAENASLRAQLEQARTEAEALRERRAPADRPRGDDTGADRRDDDPASSRTSSSRAGSSERGGNSKSDTGARLREMFAGRLDRLLRRVERGGLNSLELHRALRGLKDALPRL